MQIPLQVTFRHMKHSDAVEAAIRERAAKLEELYPALVSCRVVVDEEGLHKNQGHRFTLRLDVHMPGREFVVTQSDEDVYVALRDAFDSAKRKLDEEARVQRGDVKSRAP